MVNRGNAAVDLLDGRLGLNLLQAVMLPGVIRGKLFSPT
jgi:hypothetical protein